MRTGLLQERAAGKKGTDMVRILALLIGYGFGLIQSAYIIGKIKGIDIRNYGSGNAGTTNAMRVLGTKPGLAVFFLDMFKCFFAIVTVSLLLGRAHPELYYLLKVYAFAGCVLGHDYPFYMKFRGGKGVAVIAGFVLGFHWTFIPMAIIVFFVPFLLTHYVSLGSLLVYTATLLTMIIEGAMGVYGPLPAGILVEMDLIMAGLTAMAYWRHRANIGRLCHGCERKTYVFHRENNSR